MKTIKNPILPGFHPDPSIVSVGNNYYIATSTFEWYPGVCIYHSNDLVSWQLVAQPLARTSLLDMRGNPDSCGVWAPCLSVKDGKFYLAYTNTRRFAGDFKDTPNFITTADDIAGPWSEPLYVNSSGFDPSLFHDTDGKSYWLNMIWNHRPVATRNNFLPHKYFGGIVCQEIDVSSGQLLGEPRMIYKGSPIGLSEGPHISKRGEYYYLMVAEGGTGKDHAFTVARSKHVFGPYETMPKNPLVTSANAPQSALKRAGHGDWCETPDGKTVMVHLCSRPLPFRGRSVMGRETALQFVTWDEDGWPRLEQGGNHPFEYAELATGDNTDTTRTLTDEKVDFSVDSDLPNTYQSLRYPLPSSIKYINNGRMCLHGQESLGSWFEQSLLARRQQSFKFSFTVEVDFQPANFQQMAGLTCYYNAQKYIYLHVTHDEALGRVLDLSLCAADWHAKYPLSAPIALPETGAIQLRANVNFDLVAFEYKLDGEEWQPLGVDLDYSVLSDEMGDGGADANFTGSFVGFCCQDLTGQKHPAYFNHVHYLELGDE